MIIVSIIIIMHHY